MDDRQRHKEMEKCRKRASKRLAKAFSAEYRVFLREEYARSGLTVRGYESVAEKRAKEIANLKARLNALESGSL